VVVKPLADLELSVTASKLTLEPGERVTLKFELVNHGPSPSTAAVVEQPLGDAFIVENAISNQGDCVVVGDRLRCELGTLAVGSDVTGAWVETLPLAGVAHATVSVLAPGDDPQPEERELELSVQPK
jgi:hypothetical protein